MAFGNGPRIVTDGLVLSLDAADRNSYPGSGIVWIDVTNNNNNGTLGGTNTPTFSSVNSGVLNFRTGSVTNASPSLVTGNNSFTKSAWILSKYKGSVPNHPNIISWGNNSTNNKNGLALQTDASGNPEILHWFFANDYSCSIQDITNIWSNITVTYQSPTLRFYLNGTSVSAQTVIGTPNVVNSNLEIGVFGANNVYTFSGSIANIQVYNRALSASEIQQNYNAQKSRFGL